MSALASFQAKRVQRSGCANSSSSWLVWLVACALWVLTAPVPAMAQSIDAPFLADPDEALAELQLCLDGQAADGQDGHACLGHVRRVCARAPGSETTQGQARCASVELAAWDRLLNAFYQKARGYLDDAGARQLRRAQLAWITFRDEACAVWGEVFRGGSMVLTLTPDCLRELTGRRALDLRDIAEAARPL